jgi:hypothetical protein
LAALLFIALGAATGYLYVGLEVAKSRLASLSSFETETLDKYLDKAAGLVKLDVAEQVRTASVGLDDKLDAMRRNMVAKGDLDTLARRVDSIEDFNRAHTGKSLALLSLSASIKDAVAYGRPYKDELSAAARIATDIKPAAQYVEVLKSLEDTPIPPDAALVSGFANAAPTLAFDAKHKLPDGAPWYRRWLVKIKGLVKVRRLDAPAGAKDGLVAQIGAAVAAGDFAAAHAAYEKLEVKSPFGDALALKAQAAGAAASLYSLALSAAAVSLDK